MSGELGGGYREDVAGILSKRMAAATLGPSLE
jgi:hypothetical protein